MATINPKAVMEALQEAPTWPVAGPSLDRFHDALKALDTKKAYMALAHLEMAAAHLDNVTEMCSHDNGFADELLGQIVGLRRHLAAEAVKHGTLPTSTRQTQITGGNDGDGN